jgi:thiamine-phosphate pyrophosphorylase
MIDARVLLVTDPAYGDDVIVRCVERSGRSLPRGALCVQLRVMARAAGSLRLFAWRLRVVTRGVGASLVVNGAPSVARDVGADGVHLASDAGTVEAARSVVGRAWVTVAAHTDDDVRRAAAQGADAVIVSPIFDSRPAGAGGALKQGRGVDALRSARRLAGDAAVFALGGVGPGNARACREAGAHGVAVMKALLASPSPGAAARAIHDAVVPRW